MLDEVILNAIAIGLEGQWHGGKRGTRVWNGTQVLPGWIWLPDERKKLADNPRFLRFVEELKEGYVKNLESLNSLPEVLRRV